MSEQKRDESGAVPTAPLAGLLRGYLREMSRLVEMHGEAAMAGSPLSLPLNHLLDAVVAEPGVTVTTIAGRLHKSQQAISQAADRLERLGFIERRIGSGRAVALHATSSGRDASADGVRRELASEQRLRALLGPDRYDALVMELQEACRALRAADQEAPGS